MQSGVTEEQEIPDNLVEASLDDADKEGKVPQDKGVQRLKKKIKKQSRNKKDL